MVLTIKSIEAAYFFNANFLILSATDTRTSYRNLDEALRKIYQGAAMIRTNRETDTGRLSWDVPLRRRGSLGASLSGLKQNIHASNNTFQTILTKFKLKGLHIVAFVALSDTFRGKDEGEYHPLIEPSPSYGRVRDGLGGWLSSLIGGSHLTDVVIS
ncbi:peroxidase 72-like protein, partial [Tanacetum coccineum]